jgi:hypothetical protein
MDAALARDSGPGTRDIFLALLVSLVVHLLAFAALVMLRNGAPPLPETPPLLDVDVVSLPPPAVKLQPAPPIAPPAPAKQEPAPPAVSLPAKQIVSPPDEGKEEAPKDTRLLSDRDNTVKEQMVRKGEPEPGSSAREPARPAPPPAPPRERPAQAKPRSAPPPAPNDLGSKRMAHAPSLDQLLPSASQIAREGLADNTNSDAPAEKPSQTERRDVMRYADTFAPSSGRRGTMDLLPDVHEGDVTLLNTKAELFAPFVRRVAQRVFQSQIITLRRDVPRLGVTTTEAAAVEAVMNRKGALVSVRVTEQSGTSTVSIDRHLQRACQQAFFDLNPPPGAESNDGNIHFVFRTQVQVVATPQGMRNYGAVLMAGLM